jgi:tRNA (guanine-N7-)-methyltransferase
MNPELVEVLHRKLAAGGELFFQSDVFELALDALAVLEQAPGLFANVAGAWSFLRESPYPAKSLREVRCEEKGMRIWRLLYRRV